MIQQSAEPAAAGEEGEAVIHAHPYHWDDRHTGRNGHLRETGPTLPVDTLMPEPAPHDLPQPPGVGEHQSAAGQDAGRVLPGAVQGSGRSPETTHHRHPEPEVVGHEACDASPRAQDEAHQDEAIEVEAPVVARDHRAALGRQQIR